MKWNFKIIIISMLSFLLGISIKIYAGVRHNELQNKPVIYFEENLDNSENLEPLETETNIREIEPLEEEIRAEKDIESLAKSITVKVLSGNNSGSGILIRKEGNIYQVITNDHVLIFGRENDSYKIITPDNKIYLAERIKNIDFDNNDLGLLEFTSDQNYAILNINKISAKAVLREEVYAAGFPFNSNLKNEGSLSEQFFFTKGTINMMSELSFRGGYKIGYTNNIKKGMSGGPIFNNKGQLIGINGRHKYPLWGNPYIFEDGSIASPEKKKEMSQLSWGIPIQTLLKFRAELVKKSL